MAQVKLKVDLEGNEMDICILTIDDVHPLFKYRDIELHNVKLSDFKASSLSTEQINRSAVILYKERNKVTVLKSKYN